MVFDSCSVEPVFSSQSVVSGHRAAIPIRVTVKVPLFAG